MKITYEPETNDLLRCVLSNNAGYTNGRLYMVGDRLPAGDVEVENDADEVSIFAGGLMFNTSQPTHFEFVGEVHREGEE